MPPEYIARQQVHTRSRLLHAAEALGNVTETCRRHGVFRKSFCQWKRRYEGTLDSPHDRSRRSYRHCERPFPDAKVQIDVRNLDPIRLRPEYQFTTLDEHSRVRYAPI